MVKNMSENEKQKRFRLKKTEVDAISNYFRQARVAIVDPYSQKVLTVVHTDEKKCRKPRFELEVSGGKFWWTRDIVSKHRGYGGSFWVETIGRELCSSSCPPVRKFEEHLGDLHVEELF